MVLGNAYDRGRCSIVLGKILMIEPKQTEQELDKFFKQIGYTRVSEDVGNSPLFKNADYVNKHNRTIVELKVLAKEHFQEGEIISSLRAIIVQPQLIDEQGYGQYSFKIPEPNRKGKLDSFEEPLRNILKKANKQLRDTKNFYFGDDSASGYVVLAQTGLTSLSPEVTASLVVQILDNEFSSINGVIICTPHSTFINPITQENNLICVYVTKDCNTHLRIQCRQIADAWCQFFYTDNYYETEIL